MRYELLFRPKQGNTIEPQQILSWFSSRKGYTINSSHAEFKSDVTGFAFSFNTEVDPDLNSSVILYVQAPAPEVIIEEVEHEVAALATHFDFDTFDRQIFYSSFAPHTRERMLRDFASYNAYAYQCTFGYLSGNPEMATSRESWKQFAEWNKHAPKMQEALGDSIFVPHIMMISLGSQIKTAITMPGPIDICLPKVDVIITAKSGPVSFSTLTSALENLQIISVPANHWRLSPVPAQIEHLLDSAETLIGKLSMPQPQSILTSELISEAIANIKIEEDEAKRLKLAATAYNEARYESALSLCDKIEGKYIRTALMLKAVALGELADYDKSFETFELYFQRYDQDPMVWNSYGYFLSTQGKKSKAQEAYHKALVLLEAALIENPDDADLWSRKAYSLLGLDQTEEAMKAATKGFEIDPSNSLLAQHIGHAYILLDDWAKAKEWLEKAVALDDFNPYSKYYLTKVYKHLGDQPAFEKNMAYVKKVSPHLSKTAG